MIPTLGLGKYKHSVNVVLSYNFTSHEYTVSTITLTPDVLFHTVMQVSVKMKISLILTQLICTVL